MQKTYYWSLAITSHYAAVCLWSRVDGETTVVAFGPEVPWESDEELVSAVDASLSGVISEMPEEAGEPTKTVFGVMSAWVSEGHIKKQYLSLIREICGKLSLSPVGFVVLPEAISHNVKQEEGGPLSAVVIGVSREAVEVSLFRLGSLAGMVEVGRSVSLSEDLIEGLMRFGGNDPLPSRFILYGTPQSESDDIVHLVSSVNWKDVHEKLTFLHDPKIEVAGAERLLVSICLAGSAEMGPVKSLIVPEKRQSTLEESNVMPSDVPLNELGFAVDADITKIAPEFMDEPEHEVFSEPMTAVHPMHTSKAPAAFTLKNKLKHVSKLAALKDIFLKNEPVGLPIERAHTHVMHTTRATQPKRVFLGIAVVALVLFGSVFGAWYLLPKADITIFISPRTLTSRETFTLKQGVENPDVDARVLPVQVFTKTVSQEDSSSATGSKTVGEKAVGKVTIRNGTANGVKLPSGALLVGPNDLKFSITESASVSAATSPAAPGTVTITAQAAAIGADYNLAESQSMKVGSFLSSEIDAVVAESFTGGSSRQITAVSKNDLDSLEKSLTQKMIASAQEEMVQEVPEGFLFIADSVTTKTTSKSFDHKAGDEANMINLKLTLEATAYAVPKEAITQAAQSLLSSQVPSGYSFRPEQVQTSFTVQKGSDGLAANVGLTANLLPEVNPDEVAKKVSGKRFTAANDYLATIPGFVRAAITIRPAFPDAIRFIPFITKNILVSVEAEK